MEINQQSYTTLYCTEQSGLPLWERSPARFWGWRGEATGDAGPDALAVVTRGTAMLRDFPFWQVRDFDFRNDGRQAENMRARMQYA